MGQFEGKTVIITGAAKQASLGFGVASAFAREGANVVVTGRSKGKFDAPTTLEKLGARVLALQVDTSEEGAIDCAVQEVVENFGRIDVLINCAQAAKSGVSLVEQTRGDFEMALETGLFATLGYMQACYPYLCESRGSVINFASAAGREGAIGQASYAAAKEAIRAISRVAANEWSEHGINVNIVCPLAKTTHFEKWESEYPEAAEELLAGIPLGRLADAEADVGRTCVFLASEAAAFITGETISLTGGAYLHA